ncbi:MAG: 16S rRNA (guanine(966)-N(2))-methyltransferase RsmD [Candidatus Saccharimonadales bacterium]
MSLRIIAGQFGGRTIATSDSYKTHPMGDRIRSSLFNILGDISGLTVLDAFAGSGSLGFEALSRGAADVTFIERDRAAQRVIAKNIETLGVATQAKLIRGSVAAWDETTTIVSVDNRSNDYERFDLIFADPPYNDLQLSTVFRLKNHLQPKGLMILSYPGRESVPTVNGVVVVDNRSYGDAALAFYRLDKMDA